MPTYLLYVTSLRPESLLPLGGLVRNLIKVQGSIQEYLPRDTYLLTLGQKLGHWVVL